MLRVIRRKLASPPSAYLTPTRSSARLAATSSAPSATRDADVPYGQAYGAGPSRLPYSRTPSTTQIPPLSPRSTTRDRHEIALGARDLRRVLNNSQAFGQYANPTVFSHHLRRETEGRLPLVTEMTRLELHAIIHHLIRINKSTLAIGLITQVIDHGASSRPQIRHLFSRRTLRTLLRAEGDIHYERTRRTPKFAGATVPKIQLKLLSEFLRSLQSIRHHRPVQLYSLLVQMSVYERRPDKAAEIFVGLVEEWVTEGRIAEGADAEGFHEGGGPPRQLRESIAKKHNSWWSGVRTWTLPGEVLSPHDRLDLWHPAKLSLGGKFKNFPFPLATSPPSMVPPPTSQLLDTILSALRLDPTVAAPADFEASMRACAILANTVLSRTLPLTSLGPLLRALESTPSFPPVYPSTLDKIPTEDAWAYEAFTQIHLALQSFFFSPPISAASFAQARANETILSGFPLTTHADVYRLQPLGFEDGIMLVRYAMEKMRSTKVLKRLMVYLKRSFNFGWTRPALWNAVLTGSTIMGEKKLAEVADNALFGQTALAKMDKEEQIKTNTWAISNTSTQAISSSHLETLDDILTADPNVAVQADETSLVVLIHHLGKTSQFDRLVNLTYTLIPFLQESRDLESSSRPLADTDAARVGVSGRSLPTHLTPNIYTSILSSLALSGKTGLAQRVYNLAINAEKEWLAEFSESDDLSAVPDSMRLPLELYTAMMAVWANEVKMGLSKEGSTGGYVVGWIPPQALMGQPRHIAAGMMARSLYTRVAPRFEIQPQKERRYPKRRQLPPASPSEIRFFDTALKALSHNLGLRYEGPLKPSQREFIRRMIKDIESRNVPVPPWILARYQGGKGVENVAPLDTKAGDAREGLKEREGRAEKLRWLAEGLIRADEEGLWRDAGVNAGMAERVEVGKVEEAVILSARA